MHITAVLIIAAIVFVLSALLGGKFARMDGGGKPVTPEWVERTLCMSFFVIACIPFAGWYCAVAYLGVVGIATGHGQYFLARIWQAIEPERFDFIVRWFFGPDIRTTPDFDPQTAHPKYAKKLYGRCVFGMFVTGTLVGLPAAVLSACYGQWIACLLFSLTGFVKAFAYVVGYELFRSTAPAEWINGALRSALALAVLYLQLSPLLVFF